MSDSSLSALRKATSVGADPRAIPRTKPTTPDTAPRMYAPSWREKVTGWGQDLWDATKDHPLVALADLLGVTDKEATERSFTDPDYEPPIGQTVSPYTRPGLRKAATAQFEREASAFVKAPGKGRAMAAFAQKYPRIAALMDPSIVPEAASFAIPGGTAEGTTGMARLTRRPVDWEKADEYLDFITELKHPGTMARYNPDFQRGSSRFTGPADARRYAEQQRSVEEGAIPLYAGTSQPNVRTSRVTFADTPMRDAKGRGMSEHEIFGHESRHAIQANTDPLMQLQYTAEADAGRLYRDRTAEQLAFPSGIDYATRALRTEQNAAARQPDLGAAAGQWMSPFSKRLSTMNAKDTASMDALRNRLEESPRWRDVPDEWQPDLPTWPEPSKRQPSLPGVERSKTDSRSFIDRLLDVLGGK